jgi:hypothetical protein
LRDRRADDAGPAGAVQALGSRAAMTNYDGTGSDAASLEAPIVQVTDG